MTTGACLTAMRWLFVVTLAACARPVAPPPATLASHHQARVAIAPATWLIQRHYHELALVELPPLPPKRGIDRVEETTCRAHYDHVRRDRRHASWQQREDDDRRLARAAAQAGGDCRIDTDALFARQAPMRIGGCRGASPREALVAWRRIAVVASTPARRAAALRNFAASAWRAATDDASVVAWIEAGDAYLAAAAADPDDLALSALAVDAYENALRLPRVPRVWRTPRATLARTQVAVIARRLDRVTDGSAADRARALRASLRW